MTTDANEARLTRARVIARAYSAHTRVEAIIVGGSVARGWADEWSDLELGIFWTEMPADEVLATLASDAGGIHRVTFPAQPPGKAADEEYSVNGLKIDIAHRTIAAVERVIGDVVDATDASWANQAQLAAIRSGIVLAGDERVDGWRIRTEYPDSLALSMVQQHLAFGPNAWLEMLAARNDLPYLYSLCAEAERRIVGTLLGLNRTYAPTDGLKWLPRVAADLPIAPPDLAARLHTVFRAEPVEGVRELRRLIDETIALVETHMPGIETTSVRERLSRQRPPWHGEG